jgi:hypothetical protein
MVEMREKENKFTLNAQEKERSQEISQFTDAIDLRFDLGRRRVAARRARDDRP